MNYQEFINYLNNFSDSKYQSFNQKIITTKYNMLGIKIPLLRKISKDIMKKDYQSFLKFPNIYYEIVLLKGLIIGNIKDLNETMSYFYDYLDLIDNWALNDTFCSSLKIVKENKEFFLQVIDNLLKSNKEYYVRVGLILLLNYYIEEKYLSLIFNYLDNLKSDLYYINMGEAWLLCEIFTKYPKVTINYLDKHKLNNFTINKTVSKIRDSYKINKEYKDYVLKYKCIK